MYKQRYRTFLDLLEAEDLDALILMPGANLQYLTGLSFHLMERPIVMFNLPNKKPVLIVPNLEREKAEGSSLNLEVLSYQEDQASRDSAFKQAFKPLGAEPKRIGVEPLVMRFHELSLLQELEPDWEFISAGTLLNEIRIKKNEAEVELMRQAVSVAEEAMRETIPLIRTGMSERELASELMMQLLRAGSEPILPFDPVVASGPNSALPHASPSNRTLQPGDLLIIDWGARVGGYISDLTRTFAVEQLEPDLETIHLIVQQANDAGRDVVKPGATCGSVDQEARRVIEAAGYGEYFIHRTGHGIGLEVHEAPYIVGDSLSQLETGMTFTVEPGIYLPGRGGVRIEDNIVVTERGGESMSRFDRALTIVGG